MKKILRIGVWLAWFAAVSTWAQERCLWNQAGRRFYRLNGTYGSAIVNILENDAAIVTHHDTVGGTTLVETAFCVLASNWVSQIHSRRQVVAADVLIEVDDPSCIAQTGQTNSYHAGDDGDLKPGHSWPARFVVQANTNLVVDALTGLMWTRNANAGSGTWDIAVGSCYFTPRHGYEDWRLPSVREMESLVDLERVLPAMPVGFGGAPFNNLQLNYWTGTSDAADTNRAWVLGLGDGTIARWARTNTTPHYWPVRSHTTGKAPVPKTGQTNSLAIGDDGYLQPGVPWPVPRFTVLSDTNLVFDNLWGRMWPRKIGLEATTSWMPALDYCAALEYGGYDDWRLPTRREAWSLIDFGQPAFLPAGHPFNGAPSTPFWTSSTYRGDTNRAWGIEQGYLGSYPKSAVGGGVWPVRGEW